MPLYLPRRASLTPWEKIKRDLRLLGQCAFMLLAGAGAIVIVLSFGFSASVGAQHLAALGGF